MRPEPDGRTQAAARRPRRGPTQNQAATTGAGAAGHAGRAGRAGPGVLGGTRCGQRRTATRTLRCEAPAPRADAEPGTGCGRRRTAAHRLLRGTRSHPPTQNRAATTGAGAAGHGAPCRTGCSRSRTGCAHTAAGRPRRSLRRSGRSISSGLCGGSGCGPRVLGSSRGIIVCAGPASGRAGFRRARGSTGLGRTWRPTPGRALFTAEVRRVRGTGRGVRRADRAGAGHSVPDTVRAP